MLHLKIKFNTINFQVNPKNIEIHSSNFNSDPSYLIRDFFFWFILLCVCVCVCNGKCPVCFGSLKLYTCYSNYLVDEQTMLLPILNKRNLSFYRFIGRIYCMFWYDIQWVICVYSGWNDELYIVNRSTNICVLYLHCI